MKLLTVLSLAAASSAFVLPAEEVIADLSIEGDRRVDGWYHDAVSTKNKVWSSFKQHFDDVKDTSRKHMDDVTETSKKSWKHVTDSAANALDNAIDEINEVSEAASDKLQHTAYDAQAWMDSEALAFDEWLEGPPHHPPEHGRPPHHRRPHHPPHHGKPNHTVYELISKSKYTTKFAKLIDEFPDLVEALNNTKLNYTIFAPTDRAFEKIPEHHPKPSKEFLKALISYHIVPDLYPAGRVLVSHTAPTLLPSDHLGSKPLPQRISFHVGLRGLTVNFISRIIAINIPATNGVIHGLDTLLVPPPNVIKIIDLLPGEFSTLELALGKTGLLEKLNSTDHAGGTFFAPSNFAFKKLGPKINAFLFSKYGLKYLKALLEYHVVPKNTLYSDAFYKADEADDQTIPKGHFHVDLPTLLEDKSLSVDIARFGGFITIKVNAFARVTVQDGIAEDGVIQVVGDVLVPPKKLGSGSDAELEFWQGEELEVEDFKARLEPYLAKTYL